MPSNTPNLLLIKSDDGESFDQSNDNGNYDKIDAGWKNHEDRLDTLETPGAAIDILASIVEQAGFDVQSALAVRCGPIAQLDIRVVRTGATIASGNIGNIPICTLPASWKPKMTTGMSPTGYGGGAEVSYEVDGKMNLNALEMDWANGGANSFSATFILATP